jgi:gamma-glutamylcyclotransferase (GGCT)/AIG2-like uncharacterized protein YtfP
MNVFVYGTLRTGYRQNDLLLKHCTFIGEGETLAKMRLFDVGPFPIAFDDIGVAPIRGEVYRVYPSTIKALDEYEGDLYTRKQVIVKIGTEGIPCQMYLGNQPLAFFGHADPVNGVFDYRRA